MDEAQWKDGDVGAVVEEGNDDVFRVWVLARCRVADSEGGGAVAGTRALEGNSGGAVAVARCGDGDAEVGLVQVFRRGVVTTGHEVDAVDTEDALGEDGEAAGREDVVVNDDCVQLNFVG